MGYVQGDKVQCHVLLLQELHGADAAEEPGGDRVIFRRKLPEADDHYLQPSCWDGHPV